MFDTEKTDSLFNCQLCLTEIKDPVFLPCGETVCKLHTQKMILDKCFFCQENHRAPQNGFPCNKFVKNQLEKKMKNIKLNFTQFNDYKKILESLNKKLKEFETVYDDPVYYINEYFGELTRNVDMRQGKLIQDIQKYADYLIQNIEKLKQECLVKAKAGTKATENIYEIKTKLNQLNLMFGTLVIDDINIEEIMSKRLSKEISDMIEPAMNNCKLELQGDKHYKLITNDLSIEDVFGSVTGFDPDIESTKVTYFKSGFINFNI